MRQEHIAVLGSGSWGTGLAHHLRRRGLDVVLWGIDAHALADIAENNRNSKFTGNLDLAPGIRTETALGNALSQAEVVVAVVPSFAMREVMQKAAAFAKKEVLVVSATKGLEEGTLKRMSEVVEEELKGKGRVAALSGPSFALEVVKRVPTAVTVAARDEATAQEAAEVFHFDNLRTYTSTDLIGVELGGAMKNVIAIACGAIDGAQVGANARAAVITRGLAEIQRLVVAMGGDALTVTGLSGLGDLLLTATGDLSRNRRVGLRLAKGEKLQDIVTSLGQVAEGVETTAKVLELAKRHHVSVPITEQVHRVISGESTVLEAITALLSRERKSEAIK